jgi:hypothetical protein
MIFLKWSSQTVNQDHQGFQRPWNMFETTDLRLHLRVPSPKLPCLAVDAADIALNPQSPVESCDSWEITWCKSGTQNKHRSLLQKIPEPKKKNSANLMMSLSQQFERWPDALCLSLDPRASWSSLWLEPGKSSGSGSQQTRRQPQHHRSTKLLGRPWQSDPNTSKEKSWEVLALLAASLVLALAMWLSDGFLAHS